MTRIYKTPFAATGDREALADLDPGTGKVSLPSGWTPDYEKENDDPNYRPLGRQEMNGILHEITASLGEMQLYGVSQWQSLVGGWPEGARVAKTAAPGTWYNTVEGNTADPNAGGAGWIDVSGILILPTAPTSQLSDLIYVLDRRQILLWQTIGTYTGYASSEVGDFRWGTSITPKPGTELLIGQTVDRTLPKYAALIAWAEANGHMVASGSWVKGAFHFSALTGNNVRLPDIRDQFVRATGTDADTANARVLGSLQTDALQNVIGSIDNVQRYIAGGSSGAFADGVATATTNIDAGPSTPAISVTFDASRIARTSAETRAINTALHPVIAL